jgi:endonuclease VIII
MPEGDTVWLTAHRLDRVLSGQTLTGADLRVPAHATADLSGWRVREVLARGKHILHRFEAPDGDRLSLHSHLKMEGSWHIYRPASRWRRPAFEARIVLRARDWHAVGFALGICELIPTDREDDAVGHLGPDLLGTDWDTEEAVRRLAADPDRTLAEALLDQRNLAGIGTLYRSETLFLSGIHPRARVRDVADLVGVVTLAQRLLRTNRDDAAQVTTGDRRRDREQWVHKRSGQPCRRCGTRIEHAALGPAGSERGVSWCPRCQPDGG